MTQIIRKTGFRTYQLFWEEKPDEILNLDFNPLVNQFRLNDDKCVLVHWQAKPKGLRRYGVYDVLKDQYYGVDYDKLSLAYTKCIPIQIDETAFKTIPTAVLLYKEVSAHVGARGTVAVY